MYYIDDMNSRMKNICKLFTRIYSMFNSTLHEGHRVSLMLLWDTKSKRQCGFDWLSTDTSSFHNVLNMYILNDMSIMRDVITDMFQHSMNWSQLNCKNYERKFTMDSSSISGNFRMSDHDETYVDHISTSTYLQRFLKKRRSKRVHI